ncbi:Protein png1 [Diaporthe australafricana]|uniref:Protein png1 n=1 Tax=Diaporthe australafricana TaxID=127596 RepID=A0ABR3Y3H2_9PEZI
MSGAPFYSSAPGRRFFIEMFKVSLDGPLYTGDCGAWIIETTKGDLIGHIVLGSPGDGNALVVPFSDIFDDISSRVGKSPTFPVAQDDGGEERTTPILNEEVVRAEGLLDVPSFENNLEESNITKHTSLDAEDVESLAVSPRDKTAITAPLTRALPEASSQLVKARNDWIGDISKEFEQLMAQKRPRPLRQRNKIQETSHASAKSNVGLGVDPARVSRSASPPRPLNFIPRHIKWPNSLAPALTDPTFRDMLFSFCNVPMEWEVPNLLDRALGQIDLDAIYGAAEEESESLITHAQSMGDNIKADWGYKDCVIRALLRYFHGSFFISIDDSAREFCQSNAPATFRGNILPNEEEKVGGLQAVELYQCPEPHCLATMRLPRYWNVWTVLRTRRGRSGEAANCFGMLCRALGSRVRWVWCAEDRVWTEVYSEHWKRWVHVDAYEGAWDDPLLYAGTLGKKMSYCIAFSTDGAVDVTRRIKKMRRIDMSEEELLRLRREDSTEVKELESYNAPSRVMGREDHRPTSTKGNLVQRKSAGRMPGSRTLRTDSVSTPFMLIKEEKS